MKNKKFKTAVTAMILMSAMACKQNTEDDSVYEENAHAHNLHFSKHDKKNASVDTVEKDVYPTRTMDGSNERSEHSDNSY